MVRSIIGTALTHNDHGRSDQTLVKCIPPLEFLKDDPGLHIFVRLFGNRMMEIWIEWFSFSFDLF